MKNLFIHMGDHINVRNFTEGTFTHRKLTAADIAPLVAETRKGGAQVQGCFEFGSVPSEKKHRDFAELLEAFDKITGVKLTKEDFLFETEDGDIFPHFDFIETVTGEMRMLVVQYYFSHQNGATAFEEMFRVSDSTMDFHLFEIAD